MKKPQSVWSAPGFEPATSRMRVSCVTTEPPRSVVIFYFNINSFAWFYVLKFCHLKTVSGAVDARKSSRGRQKMECQMDKLEHFRHFSLFRTQPFLSFPYVSKKTPFLVTSNNTEEECSMLFTSQSMTSTQRCTYSHPLICVVLAQSLQYPLN